MLRMTAQREIRGRREDPSNPGLLASSGGGGEESGERPPSPPGGVSGPSSGWAARSAAALGSHRLLCRLPYTCRQRLAPPHARSHAPPPRRRGGAPIGSASSAAKGGRTEGYPARRGVAIRSPTHPTREGAWP